MTTRRVVALVLFIAALGLERFGWYAGRSMLWPHAVQDLELTASLVGFLFTGLAAVTLLTPLLAAVIAIGVGRLPVLVGGAVFSVPGGLLVAFGGAYGLLPGLALLALGSGCFKAALFAIVGGMFPGARENLRVAAFLLLYVAINTGALGAAPFAGLVAGELWFSPAQLFAVGAVLSLVATGLGAAGGLVAPPEAPAPRAMDRPLAAALLVAALAIPGALVMVAASDRVFAATPPDDAELRDFLFHLNPMVVAGVCLGGAAVLGLLAVVRVRVPSTVLIAVGTLLLVAGAAPLLRMPDGGVADVTVLITCTVVLAVGEVLLLAVGLSRVAGDLSPRTSALGVGIWIFLTGLPGLLVGAIPDDGPWQTGLLAAAIGLASMAAVALAVLHPVIRRLCEAPGAPAR